MTIYYPSAKVLPRPLADGYGLTAMPATIRTEMDNGTPRQRRRFTRTLTAGSLSFNFRAEQFALFDSWWRSTLLDGTAWFQIQLRNGLSDVLWTVRGTAVPEATLQGTDVWHVNWKVEIEQIPRLSAGDVEDIVSQGFISLAPAANILHTFVHVTYPAESLTPPGP